jgi:glucose/arabinose dehydrogenase
MRRRVLLPVLGLAFLLGPEARAQLELSAVRVADGLAAPIYAASPPGDPRLFLVERAGRIRVLAGGAVLPEPFLDIATGVSTAGEGGLLGLAFAPDYATSGAFYVYYTAPRTPSGIQSRVSRFTAAGDPATSNDADEASEELLFALDQPFDNHNGGTIAIRDGWLYLGLGDGGSGGDPLDAAQDDGSRLGKMLRFDLAQTTVPWTPQVWAKGLRNPFRFSFDRATGDLYIGDVGQDAREEIDAERADSPGGRNYGWDVEEGSLCFQPTQGKPPCGDPSLVRPIFEYAHVGGQCSGSVTGGAVYRGSAHPALRGRYFFADYCRNLVFSLRWNRDTGLAEDVIEHTGAIPADVGSIARVSAIAEDAAGELYFVDLNGGEVFRLVPEPGPGAGAIGAATALALAARLRHRRRGAARATTRWRTDC